LTQFRKHSPNPNQINIGVAYYQEDFEKERQSWKVIEQAKDETIKSQQLPSACYNRSLRD
jgi:hypothetical protein